jgi:hypothetical protein
MHMKLPRLIFKDLCLLDLLQCASMNRGSWYQDQGLILLRVDTTIHSLYQQAKMSLIANAMADPAFLLSMEEARMDAVSPQPSVSSMESSLCRPPIPASPPCSDDEESVDMNSLEGDADKSAHKQYERIQSPTGPLPYHAVDNTVPDELNFDLGMTGNWMCVYDLDSVCAGPDLQGVQVPFPSRCSNIHRRFEQAPALPSLSSSAPAIPTGFLPEHLREVFSTGLLPHVIEWFQSSDLAALSSSSSAKTSSETAWNGYLPLAPDSSSPSCASPQEHRRRRRARSEIGKTMIRPRLSPPGPSPLQHVTLFAPNSFDEEDVDVELVYSPVCVLLMLSMLLQFVSFLFCFDSFGAIAVQR